MCIGIFMYEMHYSLSHLKLLGIIAQYCKKKPHNSTSMFRRDKTLFQLCSYSNVLDFGKLQFEQMSYDVICMRFWHG